MFETTRKNMGKNKDRKNGNLVGYKNLIDVKSAGYSGFNKTESMAGSMANMARSSPVPDR